MSYIDRYMTLLEINPNQPNKELVLNIIKKYLDEHEAAIREYEEKLPAADGELRTHLKEIIDKYHGVKTVYKRHESPKESNYGC